MTIVNSDPSCMDAPVGEEPLNGSGAVYLDMAGRVGQQGEDLLGSSGNHSAGGKESLAHGETTLSLVYGSGW